MPLALFKFSGLFQHLVEKLLYAYGADPLCRGPVPLENRKKEGASGVKEKRGILSPLGKEGKIGGVSRGRKQEKTRFAVQFKMWLLSVSNTRSISKRKETFVFGRAGEGVGEERRMRSAANSFGRLGDLFVQ